MPPSSSNILRIGTRGSRLALVQAGIARAALAKRNVVAEIVVVKTSGDRIQNRSLADAGGKGLFTKELEEALLANEIDLAVHSMKDVPTFLPKGLEIAALFPREAVEDAVVARGAATSLAELPKGARVGTSSIRRSAQLKRARPDLHSVLLRGNVDTRLAKLESGEFDAILLAVAGLNRLGLADRIGFILSSEDWLPAPAQGAIGIEIRSGDARTRAAVTELDHIPTSIAIACERGFLAALDGSCRTPIAGLAILDGNRLSFRGEVLAPDGSDWVTADFQAVLSLDAREEAARLGYDAGQTLCPRAMKWLDV